MLSALLAWFRFTLLAGCFLAAGFIPAARALTDPTEEEFAAARKFVEDGDMKGGEAAFSKLLERHPDNPSLLYSRAWVRIHLGKLQEAIDDLDIAVTQNPKYGDNYMLRAEARMKLSGAAAAAADVNMAVRLAEPGNVEPLMARARLHRYLGKLPEALADYMSVLVISPNEVDARFGRADLQLLLNEPEKAQPTLAILAGEFPQSVAVGQRLIDAEFALQHWDAALKEVERTAALQPPSAELCRSWGMLLFAKGDFDGAIRRLREALAAEPARNAYPQLMIHLAQRRTGKAAPDLKPAIDGMEDKWPGLIAYFLLGELKDTELLETAEGKADPALKKGHTCEAYYYMGQMRLLAGDRIAAKALFQQAVATGAKNYDEWALAQAELGR